MVEESELRHLFDSERLLDRIALLDIAPIKRKHVHASFVDPFTSFALHSKPEAADVLTFARLLDTLKNAAFMSFEDGVEQLTSIAARFSSEDGPSDTPGIREQLAGFQQRYLSSFGRDGLPLFKRVILDSFFMRRFALASYWYSGDV